MSAVKAAVAQTPIPKRLTRQFYNVSGEDLARALLGKNIVRMVNGARLCARIVETEAYLGRADKAAHSYKGSTDRNKAMFMEAGTAYVYCIYGMHYCFNISSQGEGCAVLIRSAEPLEGVEKMAELRKLKITSSDIPHSSSSPPSSKMRLLTNGPAKLCQALNITKQLMNQHDLVTDIEMWLEEGEAISSECIMVSSRINIAYAEEWTHKPLRFYVLNNPYVSVRDKLAEKLLLLPSGAVDTGAQSVLENPDVKTGVIKKSGKRKVDRAVPEKVNAKRKKLGKRKVKGVDDDKGGVVECAKTVRKEEATSSEYFTKT